MLTFTEALDDLEKALELSGGRGRAACQAYTQRAMIKRLQHMDEEAKKDFQAAADLGSEFAKAQVTYYLFRFKNSIIRG